MSFDKPPKPRPHKVVLENDSALWIDCGARVEPNTEIFDFINSTYVHPESGQYTLSNQQVITVENGFITSVD